MLKIDVIWPESRRFKSRTEWEPIGFFSEALCNATQFDLKLGFFSSSAISTLADGFASFLYNGGQMRMIINDILSEEDKNAIDSGLSDSSQIAYFDIENLFTIKEILSKRDKHFFECLSWLIRKNRLELKIIRPLKGKGISHSKIGIFNDGLNKVGFDGSCNFSRTALIDNIESISAFCDWDSQNDIVRIKDIKADFELTFSEKDDSVSYLDASQVRTRIIDSFESKEIKQLLEDEEKLLSTQSQSILPQSVINALKKAKANIDKIMNTLDHDLKTTTDSLKEPCSSYGDSSDYQFEDCNESLKEPCFPYGEPRDYQLEAYNKWKSEPNKQKGLFAMATGTGKTLTSLNCLLNIYTKYRYYKAIVLVPTITLVDQWEQECYKFNFSNIIKICSRNPNWKKELDRIKNREVFNITGKEASFIIIVTYASFAKEQIFNNLMDFNDKTTRQMLLIADEAHNMGSGRIKNRLNGIKIARRIGLSATPERQYDEIGNQELMCFFGCSINEYTFEYTMKEAIDNGFLSRYYYFPHIVQLTDDEMSEYIKISVQLSKFFNNETKSLPQSDDILMRLLLKRKRIIHKAKNKESFFREILEKRYQEKGNLQYTLVYVPEGATPDDSNSDIFDNIDSISIDEETDHLIERYTQIVQNISPTTTVKKYVSGIKGRNSILDDFAKGKLEVLTSMKCLDEGVDIPRSELAIFCASTGNPRQFIQRRGRILRLCPGKNHAIIHDLVVAPIINRNSDCFLLEQNLLKNELKRVRDFALLSENADFAYTELSDILSYYGLSLF